MRTLPALTVLFAASFVTVPGPDEDPFRIADIKDSAGTVTHVTGLHYCYEEAEGGEVYINKYDNFFVQRGEAVIQVNFENMAAVLFKGPVEEKKDRRLRAALVRTRSGKEVEAEIICHPNSFIKGKVDLGEFRLDLEKVEEMIFPRDVTAKPAGFEMMLFPRAETPGGTVSILLFTDGSIRIEGKDIEPTVETLKRLLAESEYRGFIRSETKVPYAVFRKALEILQEAGARTILLGP